MMFRVFLQSVHLEGAGVARELRVVRYQSSNPASVGSSARRSNSAT